jgi:hypothetical protein
MKLREVISQPSRIPFPLVMFLDGRNALMKPFAMLVADVSKIFWKET